MSVKENPAYGQTLQSQGHEYEIPSVNCSHLAHTPHTGEMYEMMTLEQSSEYVAMDATDTTDYPIYEEPT